MCDHRWYVRRESMRRGQLRLRVKCQWCGRDEIWWPERIHQAVNWRWWQKTHPASRA